MAVALYTLPAWWRRAKGRDVNDRFGDYQKATDNVP